MIVLHKWCGETALIDTTVRVSGHDLKFAIQHGLEGLPSYRDHWFAPHAKFVWVSSERVDLEDLPTFLDQPTCFWIAAELSIQYVRAVDFWNFNLYGSWKSYFPQIPPFRAEDIASAYDRFFHNLVAWQRTRLGYGEEHYENPV
jgi:hypothetical protein